MRFDPHELAGGIADIGVMLPLAAGIAASSGLDLTTMLLCVAAVHALTALVFRAAVPVQPMKATTAAIIALAFIAGWAVLVLLRRTRLHGLDLPWPGVALRLAPAPEPAELKAP